MPRHFAWYGKAFYFVELPRRFILTVLAIAVFRRFLPEEWMRWALVAVCFFFDLLIVSRAPDIRITKEEVEAKLALGAEPVFLTWREVKRRFLILAGGAVVCLAIAGYWFTHGQQPSPASQFAVSAIILLEVAYLSAIGASLHTKRELKEGDKPFLLSLTPYNLMWGIIFVLGIPWIQLWVSAFLLWGSLMVLTPTGAGWSGEYSSYLLCFLISFCLITFNVISMSLMVLFFKTRYFTHPKKR